jgi:cytochrome c-type biogenesis protein CcmE
MESNVEYTDIAGAMKKHKKVQLKGSWNKEKESSFDAAKSQFTFWLVDENGKECKVVLEGAAPNNFELATSVVAKGRFMEEGYFHATEVLTKCPSKYEATASEVNKTS